MLGIVSADCGSMFRVNILSIPDAIFPLPRGGLKFEADMRSQTEGPTHWLTIRDSELPKMLFSERGHYLF